MEGYSLEEKFKAGFDIAREKMLREKAARGGVVVLADAAGKPILVPAADELRRLLEEKAKKSAPEGGELEEMQ